MEINGELLCNVCQGSVVEEFIDDDQTGYICTVCGEYHTMDQLLDEEFEPDEYL